MIELADFVPLFTAIIAIVGTLAFLLAFFNGMTRAYINPIKKDIKILMAGQAKLESGQAKLEAGQKELKQNFENLVKILKKTN